MTPLEAFVAGYITGIQVSHDMSRDSKRMQKRKERERLRRMSRDTQERGNIYNNNTNTLAVSHDKRMGEAFEAFWKAYPRRQGFNPKKPAREKFLAAVKAGADPEAIIAGAKHYAEVERAKIGTPHIAMARTWLHQKYWEECTAQPKNVVSEEEFQRLKKNHEQKLARAL